MMHPAVIGDQDADDEQEPDGDDPPSTANPPAVRMIAPSISRFISPSAGAPPAYDSEDIVVQDGPCHMNADRQPQSIGGGAADAEQQSREEKIQDRQNGIEHRMIIPMHQSEEATTLEPMMPAKDPKRCMSRPCT